MTTWGSRSTGSPTTSVSGTAAAARRGSGPPARARAGPAARAARSASCSAAAAASTDGTSGSPGTRPCSFSSAGPSERHRTPVRTASTPTPAGPPHDRASPTSTSPPSGRTSRPASRPASTSSGTPAARQSSAASATGCRVPTSPFAACRQAAATPVARHRLGQLAAVAPGPGRPPATSRDVPPAASCHWAGVQQRGVLDRADHQAATDPPATGQQPAQPDLAGRGRPTR